jgi:N-acetylmuramoyl-L-alanine amidase
VNLEDVDNEVASILLDLTRRDTKNSSSFFAETYIKRVRKNGHRVLRRPHRHAGFAVLKSPDIPAVLIELGFLSNAKDVKLLSNKNSRKRLLISLAGAIDAYAKLKNKNLAF